MIILGIDLGKARTGVAICDKGELLASPLTVVTEYHREQLVEKLSALAKENKAELLAVGLPRNMDGTEGERAEKSRKLGKTLQIWSGLPVRMWDERQSTCEAADILDEVGTFGAHRKAILDSVSATVILEDYLAWRKEHPGEI